MVALMLHFMLLSQLLLSYRNVSAVEVDEYVRHRGHQRNTISLVLLMCFANS